MYEDLTDGLDVGEPIKSGLVVDRKDEIYDVLTAQEDLAKYEGGGNHKLSAILSHLGKVRKLRHAQGC